jgi:manganese transport protein
MGPLVAFFRKIIGPAAVIAAGTMGAGATSSLILAGAWFRYELLWAAVLILPLFVLALDSASRVGLLNPDRGMLSLIREKIHPGVAWLILLVNVPVHLFIAMGQMSVMTSAFLAIFGVHPPAAGVAAEAGAGGYQVLEFALAILIAAIVIWMLTSEGYHRMQRIMTGFMVLMFFCILAVALRGFQEIGDIALGFIPEVPPDVPVPGSAAVRHSGISIIAIIGSVLAPGALLGIPYMSADNSSGPPDLKGELRRSVINLGFIYGGYSLLVIIAGGFALFPLANHAAIDSIHEASMILVRAFPEGLGFLGPVVFSAGLFMAALTTFVVVVEIISYVCLDMFRLPWHYSKENRHFKRLLIVGIALPALLAPFWTFPALFKNLLLMSVNTVVIPLVFVALIILANRKDVMGMHTASPVRNAILGAGLLLSAVLAVINLPKYVEIFAG